MAATHPLNSPSQGFPSFASDSVVSPDILTRPLSDDLLLMFFDYSAALRDNYAQGMPPDASPLSAEDALVAVVVRLLQDPQVNPHQGSVSMDKLRFFARKEAPEVYQAAVGAEDTVAFWKELVFRHQDKLQMARSNARLKKIHLAGNHAWKENDMKLLTDIRRNCFEM